MLEKAVEAKLVKAVESIGGMCRKFVSPGWAGAPDRICIFPGGKAVFVEVKAPGQKLRPLQQKRKEQLEELGARVYVVDSVDTINYFIGIMSWELKQ